MIETFERSIMNYYSILFPVRETINTTLTSLHDIAFDDDKTVILCGGEKLFFRKLRADWKLRSHNIQTENEISSANLENDPRGIVVVSMAGRPTLAVLYL